MRRASAPDPQRQPAPSELIDRFVAGARRNVAVPRPVAVVTQERRRHGVEEAGRILGLAAEGEVEAALGEALDILERDGRCKAVRAACHRIVLDARAAYAARVALRGFVLARRCLVPAAAFYLAASAGRDAAAGTAVTWSAALQWLGDDLDPETLLRFARPLVAQLDDARFLAEFVAMLERVPPAHPAERFRDDSDASVQFVPGVASRGTTLMVCVSGDEGRMGVPHTFFHRWVSGLPVHTLYLRDPSGLHYRNGIGPLGPDRQAMVQTVRDLAERLGVDSIAILGNSNGGMAALDLALDTGAERLMLFSPRVPRPGPRQEVMRNEQERRLDLAAAAERLDRRMAQAHGDRCVLCIYGAGNPIDVEVAGMLAARAGAVPLPLHDFTRHNSILHCIYRERLAGLLAWLAGLESALPEP